MSVRADKTTAGQLLPGQLVWALTVIMMVRYASDTRHSHAFRCLTFNNLKDFREVSTFRNFGIRHPLDTFQQKCPVLQVQRGLVTMKIPSANRSMFICQEFGQRGQGSSESVFFTLSECRSAAAKHVVKRTCGTQRYKSCSGQRPTLGHTISPGFIKVGRSTAVQLLSSRS